MPIAGSSAASSHNRISRIIKKPHSRSGNAQQAHRRNHESSSEDLRNSHVSVGSTSSAQQQQQQQQQARHASSGSGDEDHQNNSWKGHSHGSDNFFDNKGRDNKNKIYSTSHLDFSYRSIIRDEIAGSGHGHGFPPVENNNNGQEGDGMSQHEEISTFRRKCGEIVDAESTQLFILLLIAMNSTMIGIATFPVVKENPTIANTFEIVDLIVLIIFTIESIVQYIFNGTRRFFKDGWLVFDLIIVIISWISVEVDDLSPFRVFRALRFVTRVSILRNVVVALFSIVPAITAIFTLLLLIVYIFAVMFTTLFKDFYELGYTQADYFGRLDYTLFTLFQILCLVSRYIFVE